MADYRDEMDTALARFDQFAQRHDRGEVGTFGRKPGRPRSGVRLAKRITNAGIAIAALIVATIAFGLIVGPIGMTGLFLVCVLMLGLLMAFSFWPAAAIKPVAPYREDMANKAVVQRLGTMLSRNRAALPTAAAPKVDAINAQLPLLESRLETLNPLDPLAQEARRLMGQHLPELIEKYEKVPAQYRRERDGDGLSVDERLVSSLDAAKSAVDDLSRRLAEQDVDAFETQGRFLESRYKDEGPGAGLS